MCWRMFIDWMAGQRRKRQKEDEFNQIVDIETEDVDLLIGEDDDPQFGILFSRELSDEEDSLDEDDLL